MTPELFDDHTGTVKNRKTCPITNFPPSAYYCNEADKRGFKEVKTPKRR